MHRNIKVDGKINILASKGLDKPLLFNIQEMLDGLLIRPFEKNHLPNESVEDFVKSILDIVNAERENLLKK